MFERTASGQQNRALFYGVSYTCYVEGGGGKDERSPDASFWRQVFQIFRPEISIKFLPRGGKAILESLAKDIIDKNLSNTLVAMDSDYDRIIGELISDPRVLYSHGYSWENDVYDRECIEDLLLAMTHRVVLPDNVSASLLDAYDAFSTQARKAIIADALALNAKSSVLPRQSPGRFIKAAPGDGFPIIDRTQLLKLISEANVSTRPRSPTALSIVPPGLRYFVGHCLSLTITMLIKSSMRTLGIRKAVASDHIRDIAIFAFSRHLTKRPLSAVAAYHDGQCAAVP